MGGANAQTGPLMIVCCSKDMMVLCTATLQGDAPWKVRGPGPGRARLGGKGLQR